MIRLLRRTVFSLLVLPLAACAAPEITYTLGMSRPATHLFEVEIRLDRLMPADSLVVLELPVWRTGRYMIFDFPGGVEDFRAADARGTALASEKTDKSTWRIRAGGAGTVVVSYLVYANESGLRTRGLDDEQGFVDGTAVFMMVPAYRTAPLTLVVRPYGQWHVTTGLDSVAGKRHVFTASGYDELADCPLVIGLQREYEFTVRGIPHVLSVSGRSNCMVDSTIAWARRIVEMNAAFWGGLPYRRYVFLLRFIPDGGGATEHLNSCVLDLSPSMFRTAEPCRQLIGLISHEFFHTWNVKRLRPRGMDPYDFSGEVYSRELWLAEGGTTYMHGLLLVRSGFSDPAAYLRGLPGQIEGDRQRPGNNRQSVTESSFDAWVKYSRNLPQAYNFHSDLYGRGALVSLAIDLEMRRRSANKGSFDELLRLLLKRYPPGSGGYTVGDMEQAAVDLAGEGMREFFARYVHAPGSIPWESLLEHAGLRLTPVPGSQGAWLGVAAADDRGETTVRTVVAGSPAYEAGVSPGDQLVALDGLRVRAEELNRRIAEYAPGDRVRLTFFRRDQLRELEIALGRDPVPAYSLIRLERPSAQQRAIYEAWLGRTWEGHE